MDVAALYRSIPNCPVGLKPHTIWHWLDGKVKSARAEHYDAVLNAWQALPDAMEFDGARFGIEGLETCDGLVQLNDQLRARFRELQDASGMGSVALLKEAACNGDSLPEGLNHAMILQWMSGATATAQAEHLSFVLHHWCMAAERGIEWINPTPAAVAELKQHHKRGLLPSKVLKGTNNCPDGLTAAVISRWLSNSSSRIRRDHLEWALAQCNALCAEGKSRIEITDDIRRELKSARERSGVGQKALLENDHKAPADLGVGTISTWLNGNAATARADHLAYVRERWKHLAEG